MDMKKTIMLGLAASLMAFPLRDRQDDLPKPDAFDDDWDREYRYHEAKKRQARDINNVRIGNIMVGAVKRPEGGYTHTSKKLSKRAKRRNRGKK